MDGKIYWTEEQIRAEMARYQAEAEHERRVNLALEARQRDRPGLFRRILAARAARLRPPRRRPEPCAQPDALPPTLAQEPC